MSPAPSNLLRTLLLAAATLGPWGLPVVDGAAPAASAQKKAQAIVAKSADPAQGTFRAIVAYDLDVSVGSGGAIEARVSGLRRCEPGSSEGCNAQQEYGTTSLAWNFQRIRAWAEVPADRVFALTEGEQANVKFTVGVHLEGVGNAQTMVDWPGEATRAHGPALPVTGESTFSTHEFLFPFAQYPLLRGIAKDAFKPGGADAGETFQGLVLTEPTIHSYVRRIRGDARYRRMGMSDWKPLRPFMDIEAGDMLATFGTGSSADLVLAPGHRAVLEGHTVFHVDSSNPVTKVSLWEMLSGVLWAKARKGSELTVATPNAICGVRGTMFRVTVIEGAVPSTCVEVEEGSVEATPKGGKAPGRLLTPADGKTCLEGTRGWAGPTVPPPVTPKPPPTPPVVPPPAAPSNVVVTFTSDDGRKDVVVAAGGTLEVNLETHGGTGAKWGIVKPPQRNEAGVVSGPELIAGASTGRLGAGGVTRWRFRVSDAPGTAFTVVFELRQPWNAKPLGTYTCGVTVAAGAPPGR